MTDPPRTLMTAWNLAEIRDQRTPSPAPRRDLTRASGGAQPLAGSHRPRTAAPLEREPRRHESGRSSDPRDPRADPTVGPRPGGPATLRDRLVEGGGVGHRPLRIPEGPGGGGGVHPGRRGAPRAARRRAVPHLGGQPQRRG